MTTLIKNGLIKTGFTKFALSAGLAAIALSSSAVSAQDVEPVSKKVNYSDLDLSTQQGQKRFETRIKMAVKEVCASGNARTLKDIALMQSCRFQAMNGAKIEMKLAIARYNGERLAAR